MPSTALPVFRSAFEGSQDTQGGKRPVIFDLLGPDHETSILPNGVKMVLHVNPRSMSVSYSKLVTRTQTKGGYVEQHWGDGLQELGFDIATGGFMRLYAGLSNITGGYGANDVGGTRRQTIAYDKYLDMLALYHNNGAIYDASGQIAFQGIVRVTFDEGVYTGWFKSFSVSESADKPYQFALTAAFEVHHEVMTMRTTGYSENDFLGTGYTGISPDTIQTANQTPPKGEAVVRGEAKPKGRALRNLEGAYIEENPW